MNKSASCLSISESQINWFIPKSRWEGASKAVHGAPGRKCFLTDSAQGTNALRIAISYFLVFCLRYVGCSTGRKALRSYSQRRKRRNNQATACFRAQSPAVVSIRTDELAPRRNRGGGESGSRAAELRTEADRRSVRLAGIALTEETLRFGVF